MKVIYTVLIALLITTTSSFAQELQAGSEVAELQSQVRNLSIMVEQIRKNQMVMARQMGLVKPQAILPGEPVPLSGATYIGDKDAKVVIMEFTDLQCPFCQTFSLEIFPQLKKAYIDNNQLLFVNRQNPITHHAQARVAAKYLLCAAEQNKFEEAKKAIFTKGDLVKEERFTGIDVIAGLDQSNLQACLADDVKLENQINADIQLGLRIGVASTPTMLVGIQNNQNLVEWVKVEGTKPFEYYAELIDNLLKQISD
ncbi:DsbA family protein [Paraglaciecola hydrolytica]|uniref:Thioredoxin domain-containing protein n=1 Tax=Paraglaciecola hydrolytica TaxID=1799789 RepID=A0A135ZYT8_9ALTE|nr:thioredoxin domain-containing protein [Paraglaciecola hydrolytica]KXI28146.1 hypothetical protein AX660_17325 [Paraglaciecola hydrolytica]